MAVVGRPSRSTDVHRTSTQPGWWASRSDRSTVAVVDRPGRSTDVHAARLVGRSTGSVDRQRASALWKRPRSTDPVDRPGRPAESSALCIRLRSTGRSTGQRAVALWIQSRSIGRSTGRLNGQKLDRWPVDRPVDRKGKLALFSCQRVDLK